MSERVWSPMRLVDGLADELAGKSAADLRRAADEHAAAAADLAELASLRDEQETPDAFWTWVREVNAAADPATTDAFRSLQVSRIRDRPALGAYGSAKPPDPGVPLRSLAEDPRRLARLVGELSRSLTTVSLRDALAAVADNMLAAGVEPELVRTAFAKVLAPEPGR